ncbi:MAG TPA: Imm49 family immunity protein [Burkholderiaceae bacterium]|nr:Imm49 family immunity protein [Burkholderiaceae bacterium]
MQNVLEFRALSSERIAAETHRLRHTDERRARVLELPPRAEHARSMLGLALDRLRFAVALGDAATAMDAAREASAWGCAIDVGARVVPAVVHIVRLRTYQADMGIPAGAAPLSMSERLDALAAACLARDHGALEVLADLDAAVTPRSDPAAEDHPMWEPMLRAWCALLRGEPEAAAFACAARAALFAPSALDPAGLDATDRPVLDAIEALATGAVGDWTPRIERAVAAFHEYWSQPDMETLVAGRFPLALAAVCAWATDHGLVVQTQSPYLPDDLVAPSAVRPPVGLNVVTLSERSARSADEIRWWLDAIGVERAGRTHELESRGDDVIAVHAGRWSAEGPTLTARFVLDEHGPALLDTRTLMRVSDRHARQARLNLAGRFTDANARMHAQEALDALDAAFARDAAAGLLANERERLRARRAEYAALLAQPMPEPAGEAPRVEAGAIAHAPAQATATPTNQGNADEAARAAALVWVEAIGATLVEPLDALAQSSQEPDYAARLNALRPSDEDYAKVFEPEAVALARETYNAWWNSQQLVLDAPENSTCAGHIYLAPAGMLTRDNALSRPFPGGYRAIAHCLQPHRVWACWKYAKFGQSAAQAYDGLVWCDDHWAWFPKPYRALAALARTTQRSSTNPET